ncbi:MAG: ATP-dependent Clp protease ATP-binding subunit [Flavobacteriaceae bacterium]|nr:ATP-dependent Clp protease ATP-binding subunit [Flavobacteriaceae bacterium]
MINSFSEEMNKIIENSKEYANTLGHNFIDTQHLLVGIISYESSIISNIFSDLNINITELKVKLKEIPSNKQFQTSTDSTKAILGKLALGAIKKTVLERKLYKESIINSAHLLLCILRMKEDPTTKVLKEFYINYESIKDIYESFLDNKDNGNTLPERVLEKSSFGDDDFDQQKSDPFKKQKNPEETSKTKTPILDNFGVDLTQMAKDNLLDPVVGRGPEIERLSQILSRRKKNNPILIGEPGVGKSAIAEGLAIMIFEKKVSRSLFNKRLISLDLASLVAGTKYRGQFEERVKALMNEISTNKNIILFIDEIHTIVGAGGATGSLDASNILKPALSRGEIQCIGATTLNEYKQYFEKDGALERRFQKIIVEETSEEDTFHILNNVKGKYEDHHSVEYTQDALWACVKLTNRYMNDRFAPDKAIDALDEAGSKARISNVDVPKTILNLEEKLEKVIKEKVDAIKKQKYELAAKLRDDEKNTITELENANSKWKKDIDENKIIIDSEDIASVVSVMTGIPLKKISDTEAITLKLLPEKLKSKVIGQDKAIENITRAIQRNRIGLKDPNKPIGSFIFLGQTGVGKTQLAKILASEIFDNRDSLIRIDMSEYMEKFSITRLIGAPPGYIGYEEGGQLTEKVRRKPYSVILLDEIEKAHPDVFNMLLQILDDGHITDSLGRTINFKNTIIIMTSNIGSRTIEDFGGGVGFSTEAKKKKSKEFSENIIIGALKKAFSPEFLNRIDDVILFNSLTKDNIRDIIKIELKKLYSRISELGYTLELSEKAIAYIVDKGYDEKYGARPIKRAVQKYVEDKLAEEIVNSNIKEGDSIFLDYDKKTDKIVLVLE